MLAMVVNIVCGDRGVTVLIGGEQLISGATDRDCNDLHAVMSGR